MWLDPNKHTYKIKGTSIKLAFIGIRNCHIWAWNLAIGKSCKYKHALTLALSSNGVKMKLNFRSTGSGFWDTHPFSNLPYLGMKLGHWQKFQKLHVLSFYPRGLTLSLFLLYRQRFPRYWPIFKIAVFGHETWPLAKVPQVAHILPKLLKSPKFHSRFALQLLAFQIIEVFGFSILGTMVNLTVSKKFW